MKLNTRHSFLQCHLAAACPVCDQWCLFFPPLSNLSLQPAVLGGWLPWFVFCLLVRLSQTGENTKSNLSVELVLCVIFRCGSKSLLSLLTAPPTWGWKCVVSGVKKGRNENLSCPGSNICFVLDSKATVPTGQQIKMKDWSWLTFTCPVRQVGQKSTCQNSPLCKLFYLLVVIHKQLRLELVVQSSLPCSQMCCKLCKT